MPQPNPSSRGPLRARSLVLLLTACVAGLVTAASAGDQAAAPGTAPAPQAGLKVNVDPKTGRFLETPAPDAGAASGRAAAAAPLVMEPSPVAGGGTGFRVPDQRFNAELKATTTPDGSANIACDAPAK